MSVFNRGTNIIIQADPGIYIREGIAAADAAATSATAADADAMAAAASAAAASTDADDAAASAAAAAATLDSSLKKADNLSDLASAPTALTNLGLTATAAEINTLDGITASTAELNLLDGVTVTTAQINSIAQFTGRNLIINGSGRINQRGYVSGAATSGANQFTLDRWFVVTSGQNLAFTGDDSGRVMTAPAGGVAQVIEGANVVGGSYVLNWTGTATATVNGTARTKGEVFTLTANTNVAVAFASGTFTDVQLERGSVVTPFEWRSIGQELALCQRFYQIVRASILFQSSGATEAGSTPIPFLAPMRATPTLTVGSNIQSANISGSATYENISVNGARFTVVAAAAGGTLLVEDIFVVAELTS
ncbi:MAG: hypothetical protein ACU0CT_03530 [Paracoccaceae bacterium]